MHLQVVKLRLPGRLGLGSGFRVRPAPAVQQCLEGIIRTWQVHSGKLGRCKYPANFQLTALLLSCLPALSFSSSSTQFLDIRIFFAFYIRETASQIGDSKNRCRIVDAGLLKAEHCHFSYTGTILGPQKST